MFVIRNEGDEYLARRDLGVGAWSPDPNHADRMSLANAEARIAYMDDVRIEQAPASIRDLLSWTDAEVEGWLWAIHYPINLMAEILPEGTETLVKLDYRIAGIQKALELEDIAGHPRLPAVAKLVEKYSQFLIDTGAARARRAGKVLSEARGDERMQERAAKLAIQHIARGGGTLYTVDGKEIKL